MAFGVFIHRADSIYADSPAEQYQFPRMYLTRAGACLNDWIIYYEPGKVAATRGYFAVAKVNQIAPDPVQRDMYIAFIEPGSYLEFTNPVPFNGSDGLNERGLLNDEGRISGRAQAAVRGISSSDFNRIFDLGFADERVLLPREDDRSPTNQFSEERTAFDHFPERARTAFLSSRILRDRVFRRVVLTAYDERCAITGLKLINGGGRAEVEAAHIRPVEFNGQDIINNGIALSGTAHWMFDRGLISLADDLTILVSRHVNDIDSIRGLINRSGIATLPKRASDRPYPRFLQWHREHCFKA